jgi:hypothetical protein
MDLEIEYLLFKKITKPKNYLMTRIINVFDNRYRINVYIQIEDNGLIKRRISSSYFCHYYPGELVIIPQSDKTKQNIFQ